MVVLCVVKGASLLASQLIVATVIGCGWPMAKGSVKAACKAAWMSLWLQVCSSWHMRRRHQDAPSPSEAS